MTPHIGDCTPTRDRGQSEVKRSRRNFEAGQAVKLGIGGSLSTVKVSPSDRWAWLMLDSQGSRLDFRCGQGVKHGNLLSQDLDPGRGWKYRRLCSVTPLRRQAFLRLVCTQNRRRKVAGDFFFIAAATVAYSNRSVPSLARQPLLLKKRERVWGSGIVHIRFVPV